ncbi:MAG: SpoIIE family protein phosphatase [Thermoanaerobaculia bacterium]
MYRLRVVLPDGSGFERDVADGELIIGRGADCDLALGDPYLSRRHARLHVTGTSARIEDLGSANGTLVNGVRVEGAVELADGDVIRVSETELHVRRLPEPLRQPAVATPAGEAGMTLLRPVRELLADPADGGAGTEAPDALRDYARRLRFLHEVHQALAGSIELDELLGLILDGVFTHLRPEGAAVLLRDDDDGDVRVAASRSAGGGGGEPMVSRTLVDEVMGKQQAAIAVDAQIDSRFAEAASIVAAGARSLVAAPLVDAGGCLGMIVAHSRLKARTFDEEDMELLASLAGAAALRVRNVALAAAAVERERLEAELKLARRLQESILPKEIPLVAGYELYGGNIPSRVVSGDYYQVTLRRDGGEIVLGLADVCGKGMGASLIAATLEAVWSLVIAEGCGPAEVFTRANQFLYRRTPPDKFATAFLAVVDVESGVLRCVNGAHNPPLLVRASGEYEELPATGFALAMIQDSEYEETEIALAPGDLLICYTDGIVEAANPADEQFGEDRLVEVCLAGAGGGLEALEASLQRAMAEFTQGVPYADDRTLVLLRRSAT